MWLFNDEHENSYPMAFIDSLVALLDDGRESAPRGLKTKELDHVTFKVDPRKTLYTSKRRNLNFHFLIAENLWYWSGRNSTELPSHYVKNYRQFSDDGIHQGAYGPMILEQIRYVVNTLKSDPDTRQATLVLWRPNPSEAKDKPCTLSFDFKIRDGKLNMHATMRSNDAIWGSNYDIPSFSMIQLAVAGMVGVEAGFLYLTAHSYHIYARHFKLAEELVEEFQDSTYKKEHELLPCVCEGLEGHMKAVESLLEDHYTVTSGNLAPNKMLYRFYDQFRLMMNLHSQPQNYEIIKELKEIGSPFGTIYHDRHFSTK